MIHNPKIIITSAIQIDTYIIVRHLVPIKKQVPKLIKKNKDNSTIWLQCKHSNYQFSSSFLGKHGSPVDNNYPPDSI